MDLRRLDPHHRRRRRSVRLHVGDRYQRPQIELSEELCTETRRKSVREAHGLL
jgi:hypothetical protein